MFTDVICVDAYDPKSGYKWLMGDRSRCQWAGLIWNNLTIPKHHNFMWMMMRDRLQTMKTLNKYMDINLNCVLCGIAKEDTNHLFCTKIRELFLHPCYMHSGLGSYALHRMESDKQSDSQEGSYECGGEYNLYLRKY